MVMLVLVGGFNYRLSLAERFDCTETIINQLLADSYQTPLSEWQVKTSSGLPLILHYSELYNYFIIYYNVIIIEIKCTINVMCLNHPKTIRRPRSMEKLSSTKVVPGAKNFGDHWDISWPLWISVTYHRVSEIGDIMNLLYHPNESFYNSALKFLMSPQWFRCFILKNQVGCVSNEV